MTEKELQEMKMAELRDLVAQAARIYYERMMLDYGERIANNIIDEEDTSGITLDTGEVEQAVITAQAIALGKLEYLSDDSAWDDVRDMIMGHMQQAIEMGMNKRGKTLSFKLTENEDGDGGRLEMVAEDLPSEDTKDEQD